MIRHDNLFIITMLHCVIFNWLAVGDGRKSGLTVFGYMCRSYEFESVFITGQLILSETYSCKFKATVVKETERIY